MVFYNIFTKLSSSKVSPTIALMFLAGTSFLISAISTLVLKILGEELVFSKKNIYYPVLAGVLAGLAEIFYLVMYSKNVPLNIGNPMVVGGSVFVSVIFGVLFLKEGINLYKGLGIFLIILGVVFLTKSN